MEISIETLLSRKREGEEVHFVIKKLSTLPLIGTIVRSWIRATQSTGHRDLWATLPPVVA